jgi:hypothetical protein
VIYNWNDFCSSIILGFICGIVATPVSVLVVNQDANSRSMHCHLKVKIDIGLGQSENITKSRNFHMGVIKGQTLL